MCSEGEKGLAVGLLVKRDAAVLGDERVTAEGLLVKPLDLGLRAPYSRRMFSSRTKNCRSIALLRDQPREPRPSLHRTQQQSRVL